MVTSSSHAAQRSAIVLSQPINLGEPCLCSVPCEMTFRYWYCLSALILLSGLDLYPLGINLPSDSAYRDNVLLPEMIAHNLNQLMRQHGRFHVFSSNDIQTNHLDVSSMCFNASITTHPMNSNLIIKGKVDFEKMTIYIDYTKQIDTLMTTVRFNNGSHG